MKQVAVLDLVWIAGLALVAGAAALAACRVWLRHEVGQIQGLWDDIYFRLRERCTLVADLNRHLRKLLSTNTKLSDDIQYLLRRMEETNDPHTHAAVQNGLVLTVQTAVEQFHRSPAFRADRDIATTMEAIGKLDSRLAPMRDRFNRSVRGYNVRLNALPFSLAAQIARAEERPLFPMLIPWWSTDAAAYGNITADEIRQQLQTWKAPLILAPSQRAQWPGGSPVIRVADKVLPRDRQAEGCRTESGRNGSSEGGRSPQ